LEGLIQRVDSWIFLLMADIEEKESYPIVGKVLNLFREGNAYEAMLAIPSIKGGNGAPIFDFNGSVIGFQESVFLKHKFVCAKPLLYLKKWLEEVLDQMP